MFTIFLKSRKVQLRKWARSCKCEMCLRNSHESRLLEFSVTIWQNFFKFMIRGSLALLILNLTPPLSFSSTHLGFRSFLINLICRDSPSSNGRIFVQITHPGVIGFADPDSHEHFLDTPILTKNKLLYEPLSRTFYFSFSSLDFIRGPRHHFRSTEIQASVHF